VRSFTYVWFFTRSLALPNPVLGLAILSARHSSDVDLCSLADLEPFSALEIRPSTARPVAHCPPSHVAFPLTAIALRTRRRSFQRAVCRAQRCARLLLCAFA
jgi:hypothetical protein